MKLIVMLAALAITAVSANVSTSVTPSAVLPPGGWQLNDTGGNEVFEIESTGATIHFSEVVSQHTILETPHLRYWDNLSMQPDGTQTGSGSGFVFLFDEPDIWWWYWYPLDDMDEPWMSGPCVPIQ